MTSTALGFDRLRVLFTMASLSMIAGTGLVRPTFAQSVILWEQPAASATVNDIRAAANNSTVLYALNGGGTLSISGVQFVGGSFDELPAGMSFSPASATASDADAGLSTSTGNAQYDLLLDRMAYTTSGVQSGVLEFSGLNVGTEYQIQLWYCDQRSAGTTRSMIFGDDGASGTTVSLAAATGDFGENVVGSFTATDTTQKLSLQTSGFGNVHLNALVLSTAVSIVQDPIEPIAGSNWIVDSAEQWASAIDYGNSVFRVAEGFATSLSNDSVFQSRVQSFTSKQVFSDMRIHQSKEWTASQWGAPSQVDPAIYDNDDVGPEIGNNGDANAPVFLSPQDGDYWVFHRGNSGNPYHAFYSSDMINWLDMGIIGAGYSWVTTAEYHDGKMFIYTDRPNDHDPSLVTFDYVVGSGQVFDDNGNAITGVDPDTSANLTNTNRIAVTDHGVVLAKPGTTINGSFYSLAGGSDNTVFRDPADGLFHMIHEDWSHQNAQRYSWDTNLSGHADSVDGINGFIFNEAPRPIDMRGNYITQAQATDPDSYTQGNGAVETVQLNGIQYYVGDHPNRSHLFRLTDQLHAWGDYTMLKIGETYYLFCDDDNESGIGLGYWYGDSLAAEFTYGGRLRNGLHPDPGAGYGAGNFVLLVQGSDGGLYGNDMLSSGPWAQGIEAQAGVDVDGDGVIDQWTDWQSVSEEYSRIAGYAKAFDVEEAVLDMSSLPAGYGVAFRLRSESASVSFDDVEISSEPAAVEFLLGDVDRNGVVNFLDINPFIELLSMAAFQIEADINQDGVVSFLDITPFIVVLSQQ